MIWCILVVHKCVKRLLRNRVSAQQARERKKAYLTDLETRVKELERKNSELEERLSTLQNENQMLRHVYTLYHRIIMIMMFNIIVLWKGIVGNYVLIVFYS